ncbi:hypothetical protein [Ruminiclostridium josui]|uniref:hypothetical protein n=1 Tax=Ruminiclostridium josui TaxID=1499 RepID=UPI000467BBCE|nr:hypothetical protein [Ruminiclostridium josui]
MFHGRNRKRFNIVAEEAEKEVESIHKIKDLFQSGKSKMELTISLLKPTLNASIEAARAGEAGKGFLDYCIPVTPYISIEITV